MRAASILAALALVAGCTTTQDATQPRADQEGNVYPVECRGDLSHVRVPILYVDRETLARAYKGTSRRPLGMFVPGFGWDGPGAIIIIDKTLDGWRRDDAIRHERCHAIKKDWQHG